MKLLNILLMACVMAVAGCGWINEKANREKCKNQLDALGCCVKCQQDYEPQNPLTLASLATNYSLTTRLFICPSSGHKAGQITNISQWADYVVNLNIDTNSPPDSILAYCKPENHKSKGCNVLYADNSIEWRTKEELEAELKKHGRVK
jgi:hypothetical protein